MRLFSCAMLLALVTLTWAAAPKKSTTSKNAPAKKSIAKKTTRRPATTWRNRQLVPTPDRYRQIQEALASKGYLRSEEATGVWGQNSIDALKKFQTDQNINSSGKINSLSLIALGLGPKRDTVPPRPPAPAAQ
jgi:peptidoglycan hydrolase-like protein with peptidoglycan-binding domain